MWFVEDPWPPALLCGVGALVGLGLWVSSRRVLHLLIVVGCLFLAGAVFVVEAAIVTPGEQVQQLVLQLCDDFRRKEPRVASYFSPTAPELQALAAGAIALVTIDDDLRVTDWQTKVTNHDSRAECHFRVNATINVMGIGNVGRQPARFVLTWAKEGNAWKIIRVQRLHPINGKQMAVLERSAG